MFIHSTSAIIRSRNTAARRPLMLLWSLLAAVALMMATVQPALAHDELTGSDPAPGAALETAPQKLTLTFSGNVADIGHQIRVTDTAGQDVTGGDPTVERTRVIQPLSVDARDGAYTVVWRVVSSDGHPIEGTFEYTVGNGTPTQTSSASNSAASPVQSPQGETDSQASEESTASSVPGWLFPLGAVALLATLIGLWAAAERTKRR